MTTSEKTSSFGSCSYSHTSPRQVAATTRTLNIIVPFDEALKLHLALDECLRRLNKYNMSTKAGKRAAVNLTVHLHANRIAVNEGKLAAD